MDYKTIANDGIVEEEIKKSRFICHLKRISSEEEGREYIAQIKKEHHKANHSCSAMIVGDDGQIKRSSDDGEPSGTAGVPMLTVLEKQGLTNVVAVVIRYFGGIKLGTSGLIVAYKAAAAEAIAAATIIEKTVDEDVTVMFEYPFMNDVMRIVKEEEPEILNQSYDMDCSMTLRIRRSMMPKLRARLEKVETARILDDENIL